VQKKSGVDKDRLYAMKITKMPAVLSAKKGMERHKNELRVHENVTDYPFLVGMYCTFVTVSKICLMLGESIKLFLIPRCLRIEVKNTTIGRAVTGREHIHSTFIILNRHTL
jgi:hypothetical protein